MKVILFAAVLACSALAHAQLAEPLELTFAQRIAQCENAWFGARTEGGDVVLGYVYIDPDAGFTYEHYGTLQRSDGVLRAVPSELYGQSRVIHRIDTNVPATCLTGPQAAMLGLPSAPESMAFYKDERSPGEHHARWAFHYNHIGASDIALDHVMKALAAGVSSNSLTFEHAFALNVLGRYGETVVLLEPVVASSDKTADLIAELAFAKLRLREYDAAITLYGRAIDHRKGGPSTRRWEFARNIAAAYAELGDVKQRDAWLKKSERLKKRDR